MASYDVRARSRATPERVWSLLQDASTWPDWSPIDSYDSETAPPGEREIRVFRTGRNVSREQIVEEDQARRMVYRILSGSSLLRDYVGRIDLEPDDDGGTRIRWRATWRAPLPGLGAMMARYLRRFQQEMVDGLARRADDDAAPAA